MSRPLAGCKASDIPGGIVIAVPLLLFPLLLSGQLTQKGKEKNAVRSLGLSASYTYTLVHTPEIDEVRGSRPIGISGSYQEQFLDSATWKHCGCYPRTGVLGGWFYLDDPGTLGNSFFLAGFAEPFLWTGKKMDLSIRGVFGANYLDSPYHPRRNPENRAYSTHFSFFLQIGIHGHFRLNRKSTLKLSAVYDHSSNGGVAKPNKGLNHPGLAIGYERALSELEFPDRAPPSRSVQSDHPRLDVIFFGGGKSIGTDHDTFYPLGGHSIKYAYPLNQLHTLSIESEWVVDGALKKELQKRGIEADHQRVHLFPTDRRLSL
ncbi:MAG: acyloxyacyl hydrolase [Flavobacteriales bacterium]